MKIKTSELTDIALDWAVAHLEKHYDEWGEREKIYEVLNSNYSPSTDWEQSGPIIERERIDLHYCGGDGWMADLPFKEPHPQRGPTSRIAAMRCYVASKLGDEVEIPEELV